MVFWKIVTFACIASLFVEAKWHHLQTRETPSNICDPIHINKNKVHCYCTKDHRDPVIVRSADCYINEDLQPLDDGWDAFSSISNIHKLTFAHATGKTLKYVPTKALKHTNALLKLDINHADIEKVDMFAFANLSFIEEITLRNDQVQVLESHSFAHLRDITTISLDTNQITEINREVFVNLPSLEKLFLTSNKITTIHDRAFVHLVSLRELEIDRNGLFSLNSETFSGLKKLLKLDMSNNNLEVIGDNTFLPLINLRYLNLEGNKIQMLDEKAFNGLPKLQTLSLARNNLKEIDNVKVFEGLEALTLLSLKKNQLRSLKPEVMAPILNNFYGATSRLDVEDNNFPCDCRLDWFISLMNKTQNNNLRIDIENLKCYPDAHLREAWAKIEETEKSAGQVFESEDPQVLNGDYEYYDESQLNGKLFYIDVRELINCTNAPKRVVPVVSTSNTASNEITKETTSLVPPTIISTPKYKPSVVPNQGLLDLSLVDTTPTTKEEATNPAPVNAEGNGQNNSFTTTRLVTVSAKPINNKNMHEDGMASDEAKPERNTKAHRSIQDEIKDSPKLNANNSSRNYGCVSLLVYFMLCFRLLV